MFPFAVIPAVVVWRVRQREFVLFINKIMYVRLDIYENNIHSL